MELWAWEHGAVDSLLIPWVRFSILSEPISFRAGDEELTLLEETIQGAHQLFQVDTMFLRDGLLPEPMIGIRMRSVILRAKWDRREVRGFLRHSPCAQGVCMGSFDNNRPVRIQAR